jgi:hypothetical protein
MLSTRTPPQDLPDTPQAPAGLDGRRDVGAAETALAFAVATATADHDAASVALRTAVSAYVAALKERGVPPEGSLITVKRAMLAAGAPGRGRGQDSALAAQVASWFAEAYHHAG